MAERRRRDDQIGLREGMPGLAIQRRIISRVLESERRPKPPLFFKLFDIFPVLRRLPARLLGVGISPEHVRTTEAGA